MTRTIDERPRAFTHAALRIAAGLMFASHGAQKLFGWFGGLGPEGGTAVLASQLGVAGVIELVGGLAIAVGLFTRLFAFIASGEMAAAYLIGHVGWSGKTWWWENQGELALLFAFVWLFFAVWGAGSFSLDALRKRDQGLGLREDIFAYPRYGKPL